jgi:hypothetical protein
MKKIITILAACAALSGCQSEGNKDNDPETAKKAYIDSMQNAMMQQHLEDSLNNAASTTSVAVTTPEATQPEPAVVTTKPHKKTTGRHEDKPVVTAPKGDAPTGTPSKTETPAPAPAATTTPSKGETAKRDSTPEEKKKKGLNNSAKGAIIGAGAGAAAGAVLGGKDNRVKGAVIGGILGAGAGAVGGAVMDKNKKKKAAQDSAAKRDSIKK